jgi:hypothetical protein
MVLFKIDVKSVAAFKFKRDAPCAGNPYGIARRRVTMERVSLERRKSEIAYFLGLIENIQAAKGTSLVVSSNF